jgi:hypothetical protein
MYRVLYYLVGRTHSLYFIYQDCETFVEPLCLEFSVLSGHKTSFHCRDCIDDKMAENTLVFSFVSHFKNV